jgi:hypothetical protein
MNCAKSFARDEAQRKLKSINDDDSKLEQITSD